MEWYGYAISGLASALVVANAALVMQAFPRLTRRGTGLHLAATHTLLLLAAMAVAPLLIFVMWDSPYGDVYLPYFVVPGLHINIPANRFFGGVAFPWLLGFMGSFPASILCLIVGPGLVGLLVGGVQWYLIGAAWDRVGRLLPRAGGEK